MTWRFALALAVTAVAVVLIAPLIDGDAVRVAATTAAERPWLIAAAAIAYTAAFWLRALAWRCLMETPAPVFRLFANLQTSLALNHALPWKAGEVARPLIANRRGVPLAEAITTTVAARLIDLVALATIAIVLVPAAWTGSVARIAIIAAGAVLFAVAAALFRRPSLLPAALLRRVEQLRVDVHPVPVRRVLLAAPLVIASWLLEGVVLFVAAQLLGLEISIQVAAGVTAVTILFQAVQVTPGGIGTYETVMTAALASQSVGSGEAALLAVLTHGLKFLYSFTVGLGFALVEGVALLRGRRDEGPKAASRIEVVAARAWNVLNEGKPFTLVFTAAVLLALALPQLRSLADLCAVALAGATIVPLALLFYRFDFPLRLRAALWLYLASFIAVTRTFDIGAATFVIGLYLGFTVVLWGTIYYHLRIGTAWTNGFRFVRLVFENPDPTSGNLQEQIPKVLLLVFAFQSVISSPGAGSVGAVALLTLVVGLSAPLLHLWFFTWVPPLPQPVIRVAAPPVGERISRRLIVIVIDGCRADRLAEARTPVIDRLRAEGTEYRAMSTVYPARTVTCFSSMLTGAPPAVHGMHSNFVPSLGVKCESLFDLLTRAGMKPRLVGIAHLIDAFGPRDLRSVTAVMDNDAIDDALVARAKEVIEDDSPDLLVLQLLSVDQTGHARGSYNPEYLAKIEETDAKIGSFLEWCDATGYLENATVLLTADHGQGIGIGGHGHMSPSEIRIPCILWGEGVVAGAVVDEPRFIMDIAATASACLGLPAPAQSVGRTLLQAASDGPTRRPVVFVVPARNEAANLPSVLASIRGADVGPAEVVVVDDGSTDGTAAVARAHGALVVSHERNRGLGAALRTGLAVARGLEPRAVVYLDADGEYDASEAGRLLAPIEQGEADYVLGSRFKGRARGMTRSRRLANAAFSGVLSFLCRRRISDGQTGFRAFSPEAAAVAEIIHDYNYAQVLTLDLVHKRMRLAEVPITHRRRSQGRSFVRPEYLWRVPVGMLREILAR